MRFKQQVNIRCVIFDCDGTLIDSEKLCLQAIQATLASIGIKVQYACLKTDFQGVKIHRIFETITQEKAPESHYDIEVLIRQFRARCKTLFEQSLAPIEGVRELLDTLIDRGVDICIASNAPLEKMDLSLALTELMPYFEGRIFSAFEANAWKPDPHLLHFAMQHMGRKPEECLFIDDSIAGVEAGINANIQTLYFVHDPQARQGKTQHPLVAEIQDIRQCLDFLS